MTKKTHSAELLGVLAFGQDAMLHKWFENLISHVSSCNNALRWLRIQRILVRLSKYQSNANANTPENADKGHNIQTYSFGFPITMNCRIRLQAFSAPKVSNNK